MNLFRRASDLRERMDDPDCDPELLRNTYRQFDRLNRLLPGWRGIYRSLIRPRLTDPRRRYRVLDIGCGGGGLLRDLYKWAGRDGYKLSLLGIDEDPRAIAFAAIGSWPEEISFVHIGSESLAQSGESFDIDEQADLPLAAQALADDLRAARRRLLQTLNTLEGRQA